MKTREDLVRMVGVLVTTAKLLERDYDAGIVKWREYVRRSQDVAMQLQVLLYVLVEKECFYAGNSVDNVIGKALAFLEKEGM